ncbi:DinB family protein [Leptospira meyeri]|uniref:DinB family protein n=1 Tax=Leptospira meyeri TaxID=29508 RepID=UPI000C2AB889|nr:DinB family protein [Leptospira meyeri]PKA24610.1 damage-inducible protein [Leptospira sp. mixed culture ATI2-C-A1]MCW7488765.1 DinB family protein [Leptospira meyeri]PJZ81080.1 damage-inducible protein [Leptospira meyeri]PJZ96584.1 damage-inducible protein [Leptospira meyeri]PKA12929.1 damage-inducible protein [Leptospira meyeri]
MKEFFLRNNAYHIWATNLLYDSIDTLSEEDYKKDIGLFFKSIHGTLNHLLLVEKVWYSRLIGEVYVPSSLADELETNRQTLKSRMIQSLERWDSFLADLDNSIWETIFRYKTMRGFETELIFCDVVQHNFNHRTHHRGQITAAITQLGGKSPEIDYVYYLQTKGK